MRSVTAAVAGTRHAFAHAPKSRWWRRNVNIPLEIFVLSGLWISSLAT